jgi:PAS domain-containing protein
MLLNILESITDAFFTLDHEWRFTYINRGSKATAGCSGKCGDSTNDQWRLQRDNRTFLLC